MDLFGNIKGIAIGDNQAIAKAIGKSNKQRRGMVILQRKMRKLRGLCGFCFFFLLLFFGLFGFYESPLEKSESSG